MKTMMVRGSPLIRPLPGAAAVVIVVFGLKYSSDVLAPIFLAATLAILFTPALWWLEKKGLPFGMALGVWLCGCATGNPCHAVRQSAPARTSGNALPSCVTQGKG